MRRTTAWMNRQDRLRTVASLVAALAAAGAAQAYTLDFGSIAPPIACSSSADGLGSVVACTEASYLLQSYGDIAGVVDVGYAAPRLPTPVSLHWWDAGYNSLYGVAYADANDADSLARIELKAADPGARVTLTGFDLGAWPDAARGTQVNVYAIGGGVPLYTFSGTVGQSGGAPTTFQVDVGATGGLWIEWADSAYNVGIDNIHYSVSAVPEPASALLLLAGAAALARHRRRG